MTAIDAEQAVKLKAEGPQAKQLAGDQYNPNSRSITLASGWNWLGYPIDQMLTLDDALKGLPAEEGDVITNLTDGFAEYVDGILYINIYGNDGDGNIIFKAIDAETEKEYELTTVLPSSDTVVPIAFQADVLGSFKAPLQLKMETLTGISAVKTSAGQEMYYNLQGQRIYKPTQRGVYIQNGQKVVLKDRR